MQSGIKQKSPDLWNLCYIIGKGDRQLPPTHVKYIGSQMLMSAIGNDKAKD